jgi:hypothetical protein
VTRIILSVFQRIKLKRKHNYLVLVRHDSKTHSDSTNMLAKSDIIKIIEIWLTACLLCLMDVLCNSGSSNEFHLCSSPDRRIPLSIRGWRLTGKPHMRCNGYVLTSSSVDFWFDPRSCQPKNYTIGMCCFSSKHASLRRKIKDWLGRY